MAVLAVNTERAAARELAISTRGERYTLTSARGRLAPGVELNGKPLGLGRDGAMPALDGVPAPAGPVALPAASLTFLAFADAGSASCR